MKYVGENALAQLISTIVNKLSGKVDKVDGKGLSEANFTLIEKLKLEGVQAEANKYTLPAASANTLGGVKPGAGLDITPDGVLSVTNGGVAGSVEWGNVQNKPETYPPSAHSHGADTITGFATVATSGNYSDLINPPTIPTNNNQLANGANYQTSTQVQSLIDAAVSSVYKPAGSITSTALPAPAESVLGLVYNVTDAFNTTVAFVEGAGKAYPAGTNVVCVDAGSGAYKWDVLAGFVDLTDYTKASDFEEFTGPELQTIWNAAATAA